MHIVQFQLHIIPGRIEKIVTHIAVLLCGSDGKLRLRKAASAGDEVINEASTCPLGQYCPIQFS